MNEARERHRNLLWGIPASLILHVLVAALLIYGVPPRPQQPREEQPVNVAIVPPPDQPKPKPVPPPPTQPKAEKPPEPKVEKPPEQPPKPVNTPVLKRVFQYGEKDTGPEKSLDGGSAQVNAPLPAKDEAAKPPVEPKPAPTQSAAPEQEAASDRADEKPATAVPAEKPAQSEKKEETEDTDKQQATPQTGEKQAVVAPKPLAAEAADKPAPPSSEEKAKPKPAKPMKFKSATAFKAPGGKAGRSNPTNTEAAGSPIYSGLPGVRKLYSQGATGNALATSSMDNVPRDQRVANLCGNVLDQELQSADYSPKWVPTIPLKLGNVLNPQHAAFSTRTQWYSLNFRCEVDADATRVLSFNFRVGSLIPPGEWASRGFTKYPLN
ncbi:DUF930 domain-containing protein [Mesorhizobium sp. M00.F.Ca.ET.151.01.1.1]|uniref:DUF930 domain-containing protein n=1 Tax=unclassified Mesorhizobium TaxID=325217 RepID=UPI000FE845D7|nr:MULTISPECIES: DUF930 domain-containing protein [unclassified Mesorhizobium]RWC72936.1 MAG: DUF930 domain-containing protein [Mesorhizobium sp.]TGU97247.1 DUF930 domain-containing protein [Mesorhizobium sp. M00.F.Ca.ET.151.01.1.1]TGV10292.1 DUF930 domain-containing protein [Mesorhizobium sp. M8A.F.Ca.ET.173.01.1.1]TGQ93184.1 DUF930 domain-containing protein [Mesorhizobium sp. M8A.F.Ca.ET.208.01.1.1]TGT53082.1 DUF930 domain-containing protein [Mesorhizobium sp. M8A.F.Ca.ET.167.01.1.1]